MWTRLEHVGLESTIAGETRAKCKQTSTQYILKANPRQAPRMRNSHLAATHTDPRPPPPTVGRCSKQVAFLSGELAVQTLLCLDKLRVKDVTTRRHDTTSRHDVTARDGTARWQTRSAVESLFPETPGLQYKQTKESRPAHAENNPSGERGARGRERTRAAPFAGPERGHFVAADRTRHAPSQAINHRLTRPARCRSIRNTRGGVNTALRGSLPNLFTGGK